MTATTTEAPSIRPATSFEAHPMSGEIDLSCRTPVLLLFTSALAWLILSLVTGLLASIKSHAPGMLADVAMLTYGRVAAVSSTALVYGFLSQAAIAAALWLMARLGRTLLVLPSAVLYGWFVWNLGVLLGIGGIFAGGMTQYPLYEMPATVSLILFVAFGLFGLSALLTFVARTERQLFPSVWFLFAALFVFPWILSVAYLMLGRYGVRGVVEPVVAGWYANNLVMMWLAPVALAVIFYLIPKLSQQPLYSPSLAALSFWLWTLTAHLSGFQNNAGVPNWLPVLSSVANTVLLCAVAAMAYNWYQTWAGHNRAKKARETASSYVVFSSAGFVLSLGLLALISCPVVDEVVGLTVFVQGTQSGMFYGFMAMAFFAVMLHAIPRLANVEWPAPKLTRIHFGLSAAGIILVAAGLMLGGYVQGNAINDPSLAFNTVSKRLVPYIGISTIGQLLLLGAQAALFWHLVLIYWACWKACCGGGVKEVAR